MGGPAEEKSCSDPCCPLPDARRDPPRSRSARRGSDRLGGARTGRGGHDDRAGHRAGRRHRRTDTETHPTFAASYLSGVSGPRPERTVSLAGTWGFTPITNTVCTGGGPFGTTTGPFLSCVDSPASGEQTTIPVPGGGWVKQGYIDLSEALSHRTIRVPNIPNDQVTLLDFGAINHKATLWVDGQQVGTQVTSYTSSVFDISDYVRPGKTAEIKVLVQGRKALVGPDSRYTVAEGAPGRTTPPRASSARPTSRSSLRCTSPTRSCGPRWATGVSYDV